jgi:predicted nucleic acid-binding Zn ribbon protein
MEGIRTLLRDALPQALRRLREEDRLEAAWVLVCGPTMAKHSRVADYHDGVVRIEVRDRAWLEQMGSMSTQLQRDLGRISGVMVNTLHFVVEKD